MEVRFVLFTFEMVFHLEGLIFPCDSILVFFFKFMSFFTYSLIYLFIYLFYTIHGNLS